MNSANDPTPRLQLGIGSLLALTTAIALLAASWSVATVSSKVILAVYMATFWAGGWNIRRSMLWLLPAFYLPYLWLVWDYPDYPWNGYRWQWISSALQLPGFLAQVPLHPLPNHWGEVVTGAATLVEFFVFVMLGRSSLRAATMTAVVVLGLSAINSTICLALFRA